MNRIRFGTTSLGDEEIEAVTKCLRSGFVSAGSLTAEFERLMAESHGYKYAVSCNSGGSAILVAATAAKKLYNISSIAVPAITYIQSIAPLIQAGIYVHLVDVEPTPHAEPIYDDLPNYVKAHLPVHLLGRASRHRPPQSHFIIEDNAESIYAPGVGYGDVCCLSFNSTHLITTGAGGMILTNDKAVRDLCWTIINHGRPEDRSQSSCAELENHYIFTEIGYSMKTSDINSAIGVAQHHKRENFIRRRRANAEYLTNGLKDIQNLMLPEHDGNTYMAYQMVVKDDSREALRTKLHAANIETRPLMPITNQPIIKDWFGDDLDKRYPGAAFINNHGFFLGCHQNLVASDLDRIIETIRGFYVV